MLAVKPVDINPDYIIVESRLISVDTNKSKSFDGEICIDCSFLDDQHIYHYRDSSKKYFAFNINLPNLPGSEVINGRLFEIVSYKANSGIHSKRGFEEPIVVELTGVEVK